MEAFTLLELQVKIVFGRELIYPMNETAQKLAAILGRKTITREDLAKLKDIGFQVKWVPIAIE